MLRSAASKVMWVGRATVFLVGLAVILALVFGVASTAMGANGGNFILGKKNVASAVSTLVKQGPGPALNLVVQSGQPPMKVNSAAKVANLNSDRLDNREASSFANGVNGKATDADKLDGKDSSKFASASHDHDTRYSPKLFAAIKGQDASAIRSSNLEATFKFLDMAGSYEIVFNRDIRSCVYNATLINETAGRGDEAPNGEIGVRPLSTNAQGVSVTTYNSSGTREDRDFSLVVHC